MLNKQRPDPDSNDTAESADTRIAAVDGARISKERVRGTPQLSDATTQLEGADARGVH